MITIKLERPSDAAYATKDYLQYVYEPEWFDDPFVKQMILDVDNVTVHSALSMEHPYFGVITFRELSSGVSLLILLLKCPNTDFPLWITKCGDNCTHWIAEIAKKVDTEVYLTHHMRFNVDEDVSAIRIKGTDEVFHTGAELNRGITDMYLHNKEKLEECAD